MGHYVQHHRGYTKARRSNTVTLPRYEYAKLLRKSVLYDKLEEHLKQQKYITETERLLIGVPAPKNTET